MRRRLPHRIIACCLAVALSVALAACGSGKHPYDATAENNGYYVKLDGISYQLQISRELNQYAVEDHQYLAGLAAGTTAPSATQLWYGVFLWAKNDTKHSVATADNFYITDTQNNVYRPVTVNPQINQYAWVAETLAPLGTEPAPDTTASFGPTQGGLVLFKLPVAVYNNRPLTLHIVSPSGGRDATISLDL
ncbi:MAG TPA: hypothetical protein VE992_00935 [Solirubrobacteraceae bacterium]|nr:hypothetical protein [Solirubrobacteraceae bacterium]